MSECFHSHGSNLTNADMHVEHSQRVSGLLDNDKEDVDTFISRFSFEYPRQMDLESFETSVSKVVGSLEHAEGSLLLHSGRHVMFQKQDESGVLTDDDASSKVTKRVMRSSGSPRMGVLVSRTEHCLIDLLNRIRSGDLNVTIPFVISNRNREGSSGGCTHVRRSLDQLEIPYYHVPHGGRNRADWEQDIRDIVGTHGERTDFLVLARYMQILSGDFLRSYNGPIINIHHGLLPSFKGANPYRQAFDAGVKLIGATSHFVTEDLDEGPIIEQRIERVSHRDTIKSFRRKSEDLEAMALHEAVRSYTENRVTMVKGRTVIFT
eukprot:CAMPEP_0198296784 /NCGR_PEP_ID=MMETSP1449-20131203/33950_1 /TAXON_ID=420275 /ORGANISM="Attheya septentrionalis, Strain CCMP2084" /LENGTH=320 /DNA_ID=CAMNT_0043997503 /DNA_START=340 /DNA_END=1302 /DNA_ORIENTATION=-